MPRYEVTNLDNKGKQNVEKRSMAQLGKSPLYNLEKTLRDIVRQKITGISLTNGYNNSFGSVQNSFRIVVVGHKPLEREDHVSSNKSGPSRLSERNHGRKKKIYETCDVIDFLLNYYYHIPKYPSICLEPSHPTNTCQWQRSVHAKENGFQINLRKYNCDSTKLSQMRNLQRREQVQEGGYLAKIHTQNPVQKPQNREKVNYAKECSKEFKNHHKEIASKADNQLTPSDGKGYLLEKTHAYQVKDSKSRSQNQVSSSIRSADLVLELTDFFEEISSGSECFSETLTVNKEEKEKSVVTYENAPEGGTLHADKIITYNQEIRSRQPTLYSKWKHFGEKKHCNQLRNTVSRSTYEQRRSLLEGGNNSMRAENSNRKREKIVAPKHLFDKGNYHKSSSSYLLTNSPRRRRRFSNDTFDQKVNYRPFHIPTTSSKCTNTFYSRHFPQRRETLWKSEYNRDTRRFKRHEHSTDFRLTSHNYHVRRNSQKYIDSRRYLRKYPSSSYF
uniref:Uncharacterized protein n=2 Tax=Molossus molossus TaxID=27622 RepID=A0A7J8J4E5_MOLMO|nr:hypothetical protein HJG59_000524 [Molossus molossus]